MYLEGYGLIMLTRISTLIVLASVYVLILLSSGAVLVLLTGIFAGVLTLIWSIMMMEYKFLLTMDSIIEWVVFISIYFVYIVSNTSSIEGKNMIESW